MKTLNFIFLLFPILVTSLSSNQNPNTIMLRRVASNLVDLNEKTNCVSIKYLPRTSDEDFNQLLNFEITNLCDKTITTLEFNCHLIDQFKIGASLSDTPVGRLLSVQNGIPIIKNKVVYIGEYPLTIHMKFNIEPKEKINKSTIMKSISGYGFDIKNIKICLVNVRFSDGTILPITENGCE